MKQRVLFICVHNSASSQIAEAFLDKICGDQFEAHSAGLEPGKLNPLAVEAMREIGIDISQKRTQSVFDVFKSGELFSYVISVCDETSAERCPIFTGVAKRLHWSFADPAALTGRREERLVGTRKIRDQIRARVEMWCDEVCAVETGAAGKHARWGSDPSARHLAVNQTVCGEKNKHPWFSRTKQLRKQLLAPTWEEYSALGIHSENNLRASSAIRLASMLQHRKTRWQPLPCAPS